MTAPFAFLAAAAINFQLILKGAGFAKGIHKCMHGRPLVFSRFGNFFDDVVMQNLNLLVSQRISRLFGIDAALPKNLVAINITQPGNVILI